MFVHEKEMRLR